MFFSKKQKKTSSNSQLALCHSFTFNHGNQNLGQPSLTRDSHLHTPPPKKYRPPHCFPFFPFGFCELCLAVCQRTRLFFSSLCHISSIGMKPPSPPSYLPPSLQPHSIMAVKENKAGTVSLMRSRAQSVGKKLLFSRTLKFKRLQPKDRVKPLNPNFT